MYLFVFLIVFFSGYGCKTNSGCPWHRGGGGDRGAGGKGRAADRPWQVSTLEPFYLLREGAHDREVPEKRFFVLLSVGAEAWLFCLPRP